MSGLIIGHNLGAMSALSALNANSNALNNALQQLSTGKRINSAADDASGYAISQKMQAQINGLNQASSNAQDGISMIQTASGALNQTLSILQTMRQLAVEASNSTTTQSDRQDLQAEFNQLADQINNIAATTQYNTQNLLNGSMNGSTSTQITDFVEGNYLTNAAVSAAGTLTAGNYTINITGSTLISSPATLTPGTNAGNETATISGAYTGSQNITSLSLKYTGTQWDLYVNGGTSPVYSFTGNSGTYEGLQFNITPGSTPAGLGDSFTYSTAINAASATLTGPNGKAGTAVSFGLGTNSIQLSDSQGDTITLNLGSYDATQLAGNTDQLSFNYQVTAAQTPITLQIGANVGQTIDVSIGNMSASALGITGVAGSANAATGAAYGTTNDVNDGTNGTNDEAALDITTVSNADLAIQAIDNAIQVVTTQQANLGAIQNRLQSTISNLDTSAQNLTSAESGITDADMASEMAQFTQDSVLQQASVAMLAQANQQPQLVLKLLG